MRNGRDCQELSTKGKFLEELVCPCAWAYEDKGCMSRDRSKSPEVNLEIDQISCGALIYLAVRWKYSTVLHKNVFTLFKLTDGKVPQHTSILGSIQSPWSAYRQRLPLHEKSGHYKKQKKMGIRDYEGRYSLTCYWDTSRVFVSGT